MAKYLLIAAILISLGTAGVGFVNHGTLVETKETLQATDTKLKATQGTLTTTAADLKTAKATLEATEADKTKLAADLTTAQSDITAKTSALDEATKAGAEKDAKIADLQKQVDDFSKIAAKPGQEGSSTPQQAIDQLNQQIQEQSAQIASLGEKNKADGDIIAAYKAKEDARNKNIMKQGLEGHVLAVNPAWNFVVLSIGDKQGVVNNAELLIKRGGSYLGKVRITSVEPSTSIADIVANTMPAGVAVQPGDSVIYQAVSE